MGYFCHSGSRSSWVLSKTSLLEHFLGEYSSSDSGWDIVSKSQQFDNLNLIGSFQTVGEGEAF
jgi:hypothetical protein